MLSNSWWTISGGSLFHTVSSEILTAVSGELWTQLNGLFLIFLSSTHRNQFLHSWKVATLTETAVDRRGVYKAHREQCFIQIKPLRSFCIAEWSWPDLNVVRTLSTRLHYNIYRVPTTARTPWWRETRGCILRQQQISSSASQKHWKK